MIWVNNSSAVYVSNSDINHHPRIRLHPRDPTYRPIYILLITPLFRYCIRMRWWHWSVRSGREQYRS
ncbi:hypothetical protein P692DRAFT_201291870 [Suillus brevipes Sb2]|nr:hypothetical protein P692DRAFT_201291870 [Suillus brevipes Sb2]